MNMENGTEAAQFPEKEYINGIFLAVCGGGGGGKSSMEYILLAPTHFRLTFTLNDDDINVTLLLNYFLNAIDHIN
jgi:hypothetical protein